VVRQNLRNSFPEKTQAELRTIEKEFYSHLCDLIVEIIKLLTISEKELMLRVTHENPRFLDPYFQNGGSFITIASHLGNWEWLLLSNKLYIGCEIDIVYKPLSSPFFDKLFLKIRSRFNTYPVPSTKILRIEVERKDIPRCIALAADQTPGPEGSVAAWFLNQQTLFFKGPQKISQLFSYPVFYSGIRKTGRGKYHLFVEKIDEPEEKNENYILLEFARKLERDIKLNPSYWLWSHKRWKHEIPKYMMQALEK
jgi:Kdo2-lipid IVA lauroyltransferase/acyltransferase